MQPSNQTQVAVVVLNWNGASDTLNCLTSLSKIKRDDFSIQIIIIDNGSDVDPTPEIQASFPKTKTIRLFTNIGFAAGCNVGIKEALACRADYILFLNNDTEVEPDFLRPLIAAVQNNARIGLACSLIKTMNGAIEFAGATVNFATGSFKTIRQLKGHSSPAATDYATGCSMLVSVHTLKAIGTFDENLFSYFEDTDLSLRAQRAGLQTVLVPESVVRHKGAASTRRGLTKGTTSPLKHYLVTRNRLLLVRRYGSFWAKACFILIIQPLITFYYLAGFTVRRRPAKAREFLRGLFDGLFKESLDAAFDTPRSPFRQQ